MLCIKFNSNNKTRLKEKFSLIYEIISILPTQKKLELYWSDYTFSKVPESKVFSFIQDTIMSNEAILDQKNSDKFITILITLEDKKKIQIEITPSKARHNKKYLPHIEFSDCDEESCLYQYFNNTKKIHQLTHVLNNYNSNLDEVYFYDPLSSLNCYSDISNRLWQKRNNSMSFTEDLVTILGQTKDKKDLEYNNTFNIAFNFVDLLIKPDGIEKINNMSSQSRLKASASSGSLILFGTDVPEIINLLKDKLKKYIVSIREQNLYEKEFEKVFSADN